MVEAGIVSEAIQRSRCSRLGIVASVDHARHPGVECRSHAHGTRLDGRVQHRPGEAITSGGPCCRAQRQDLGVRRRVTVADGGIARACKQTAREHDNRPDRHLASGPCGGCLAQRLLHPPLIGLDGAGRQARSGNRSAVSGRRARQRSPSSRHRPRRHPPPRLPPGTSSRRPR